MAPHVPVGSLQLERVLICWNGGRYAGNRRVLDPTIWAAEMTSEW